MAKNENKNFAYTTHRIGGTTYKVKVVFNDSGTETMEDKILRIVRNEALDNDGKCDIMGVPQMSRQSERSAS
ncbi:MAG: transposon-encoded TnpW family protein [Oscillospiraceae bacterium]|nr:transposon-encoded TnpW family protein [Oscillospiraceae bacterium]